MTAALCTIERLSCGFGAATVLYELVFAIPRRGITAVLGPAGVGKSTLLRTLARRAELLPSFWSRGAVRLDGRDLLHDLDPAEARRHVALFGQKARLYTASVLDNVLAALPELPLTAADKRARARALLERAGLARELGDRLAEPVVGLPLGLQRRLGLARLASTDPALILVDEPTRDLPAADADVLTRALVAEAERRAVLLVTHDLAQARAVADQIVLLIAGRAIATGPARAFFAAPPDPISARFVAEGNAWPEVIDDGDVTRPVRREPSSFRWIVPHRLGGMARPGLLNDEHEDLAALRELGVDTLVTLEEAPFPVERLRAHGLRGAHLPIADMAAPTVERACAFVRDAEARIAGGEVIVYHCKGGLGRTGTMLAAHLVWRGMDALHAIEEVRTIQPLYVQSAAQELLLDELARALRAEERRSGAP